MNTLYLSRRNLEVLLSKLDRVKAGEFSACTIIKKQNPADGEYALWCKRLKVVAVEDEVIYANRPAGAMHPADEPPERHKTGTQWGGPLF